MIVSGVIVGVAIVGEAIVRGDGAVTRHLAAHGGRDKNLIIGVYRRAVLVVTNTLKIMRATMLLSATSNGVGVLFLETRAREFLGTTYWWFLGL